MTLSGFTEKVRKLSGSSGGNFWGTKSFIGLVVLPVFVVTLYYALFASDRFVSESKIVIKQAQWETDNAAFSPLSLLTGNNPTGREDAFYLKEYIHSPDMLAFLDRNIGLRSLYHEGKADIFSRLSKNASREDFLEYYRDHVEILFDEISSIMTIRTNGFTPEAAKKINELILAQCERFVNEISQKIAADQNSFVEAELSRANEALQKAKGGLLELQDKYNVFDPQEQARATAGIAVALESRLATDEAELGNLRTYMNETAPQIVAVKSRIEALKKQIEKEKKQLAGGDENRLNAVVARFMDVKYNLEFKSDVYKATLTALEKSRLDAAKKIKTIVTVASPTLQEEAEYPRKLYIISLFSVTAVMVYGIARLILAIIKEHSEEV
jgi:capsular polysaccharide transport system permease protein